MWLANELRPGRKVALKLLPADFTRDRVRIQRFDSWWRAANRNSLVCGAMASVLSRRRGPHRWWTC